jgi:uncharacterized membrane protein
VSLKEAMRSVFPPPRGRVGLREALPFALFMAAFIALCLLLEMRHVLLFSAPWAFALTAVMPWLWWMHAAGTNGLSGWRWTAALLARLAVAGVFIVLLAEPRAVRSNDALTVLYAVDLSDSIGERATGAAFDFIAGTVSKKPEKDEAGLIVFARDAAVELPPRLTFVFDAVNSRLARDATSLEKGLMLSMAMMPEGNAGRVVLITDGCATEGNLNAALDELVARRIVVDVLPVEYQYEHEVWLEKLELPRTVKAGETYEAAVILNSLLPGEGKLSLRENDRVIFEDAVKYAAGKNRFALPLYLREPGYYEYIARIEPPPGMDGRPENNIAVNHLYLKGEGKALLVYDPSGDERDWRPLFESLRRSRHDVERKAAFEFPRDALSLLPYDAVLFVNVPADHLDTAQQQAVKDAVFNLGVGFLMVGGKNSFGPGGWHMTPVEDALPVTMDVTQKKVLPKGALAIILHTCEFPEGNTWGKRIAKEAIRVLGARDDVGILAYTEKGEGWIFPLMPAAKYEEMFRLINQSNVGDMPSFATTMKMGLEALKANDAAAKHMIIISDGDPAPPAPELVKAFIEAKVSVTMVSIYPHGGADISTMQRIAEATGGRYYHTNDPTQLPSIFIKEAKTLKREMIQNVIFTPRVEFPSPVLKGIEFLPALGGYVLTSPKPLTTVVLKGPEKDEVDPVLSTWRFGVGQAAAFTSDLSPNWGAQWVGWEKYDAFVKQLMVNIARVEQKSDLRVHAAAEGGQGMVSAEDYSARQSFLQVEARVTGPNQQSVNVTLKQVAPGRYQAEFPLWGKGRYQVMTVGVGDGRSERAMGGFAVPYSPEYLRFRSNTPLLEQIAQRTGGRMLRGTETAQEIYPKERPVRRTSRPALDWFLVLLAILIPLDVGVRRVQIDWSVVAGWFRWKKTAQPDATLGALLERKKQIKFAGPEDGTRRPPPPSAPRPVAPPSGPPPPPAPSAKPPAKPAEDSTTGRLLAAKKRWKKEGEK